MLDYDALNTLTAAIQTGRFEQAAPPAHGLPSSEAFVSAALAGMGWGMNPKPLVREALESGRLVELIPDSPLDIPLYWQSPSLMREALSDLTAAVQEAASIVPIQAESG